MALADIETELYTAIRGILENDTPWVAAIQEGSRVWYNDTTNDPDDTPQADGDYPRSYLTLQSGTTDLFDGDVTFGTHAADFDPVNAHWTENGLYVFELTLISQLINLTDQNKLGALSRRAIRSKGPRLNGLEYVRSIRLTWDVRQADEDAEVHEVQRFLTRMRIQVGVQNDGNTLLDT
jgi:hypothetical protein